MLEAFEHQKITSEFILNNPATLITSDPGTGKTRSVIDAFASRKSGRMLVLAPLSILGASWGDDIEKFAPHLTYVLAYAKNREKAFKSDADIIITNHDAVKWLVSNLSVLKGFDTLCIDEFTAFKNKASQRSKSALKISKKFTYKIAMSGTPNSNTILDIWHPTLLVDGGERLGNNFSKFRNQVCTCFNNGFGQQWQDKPNAEAIVGEHIKDINIRYTLEDCIDMPPQTFRTMSTTLPPKLLHQYKMLESESVLYTNTGTINAVNAGSKVKKLLQLCTGAVYDENGIAQGIHSERYELTKRYCRSHASRSAAGCVLSSAISRPRSNNDQSNNHYLGLTYLQRRTLRAVQSTYLSSRADSQNRSHKNCSKRHLGKLSV